MSNWSEVSLGDVIEYKKGFAFKSENFGKVGVPVVRISDTSRVSVKKALSAFVSKQEAERLKQYKLCEKDVVLTTVGSRPPLYDSMVGKAISIPSYASGALLNQNMVVLRGVEGKLEQDFLAINLRTKRFIYFIETLIRGNANQVSIALKELFKYKFLLPTINEQKEIISILKQWDIVIDKTEALIAAKERQFGWLKSKLLLRSKHWKTETLDHYIGEKKDKSTVPDLHPCLTSSRRGMFLQDEYFSKQVASKDNTGYKIMSRGDFTYRSMSDDGTFVFNKQEIIDKGLISPAYGVFAPNEHMDADFLYYFLNSSAFKRALPGKIQGGTRTALKLNALKKLNVDIPELSEQQAIANKLNTVKREIDLLIKLTEQYRRQKRGLMQKLLSGEWHIKNKEAV